jgi:hypothetical protein
VKKFAAQGQVRYRLKTPYRDGTTHIFGPLPADAVERLSAATIDELDAIGERLLAAQSLEEALGTR